MDGLQDGLDGSCLHCGKRIADAAPFDVIWFEDSKRDKVAAYLGSGEANRSDHARFDGLCAGPLDRQKAWRGLLSHGV
jgi:hypothetical protein